MSPDDQSNFNQEILDLCLSRNFDEHLRPLIDMVRTLLLEHFSIKELIVFSSPLEHHLIASHRPDGWLRTLFGRKYDDRPKVERTIKANWQKKSFSKVPTLCDIEGESYHFIPFGVFDDQFLFALTKKSSECKPLPALLTQFTQKGLNEIQRWREVSRYQSLIYVDDVTLLFNQRKLVIDLESAAVEYNKTNEQFSVLFIDIDHFKSVNDNHGHLVGTQLLADVASVLRGLLRDTDRCYRYGGDEFVILVPNTGPENAKLIGNRILETIKGREFKIDMNQLVGRIDSHEKFRPSEDQLSFSLSVSVGVASFPKDASNAQEILSIADQMMYQAKKSGRGQVCFAGEMFKTGS